MEGGDGYAGAEVIVVRDYEAVLGQIETLLGQSIDFVPADSQRTFRVAMSDYGAAIVLPKLLVQLRKLAEHHAATGNTGIRPFTARIPERALTDLRRRIAATRWPGRETVADESQGVRLARMQALLRRQRLVMRAGHRFLRTGGRRRQHLRLQRLDFTLFMDDVGCHRLVGTIGHQPP